MSGLAREPEPMERTARSNVVPFPSFLVPSFIEGGQEEESEVDWTLRAWEEGRLDPVPEAVALPALPEDASPAAVKVAAFAARVFAVRRYVGLPDDAPIGCEWAGHWTGMSKPTAWRALKALSAAGVLTPAGELPGRGKRGTALYLPGDAA
jgi:hypothetical protein